MVEFDEGLPSGVLHLFGVVFLSLKEAANIRTIHCQSTHDDQDVLCGKHLLVLHFFWLTFNDRDCFVMNAVNG